MIELVNRFMAAFLICGLAFGSSATAAETDAHKMAMTQATTSC